VTRITELKPNQVFVFGSNLAGLHGGGAAADAARLFAARNGVGEGMTGQCYAIPTLDTDFEKRTIDHIAESVRRFLQYAKAYPELEFIVTPIGTGIAGFRHEEIAPLFQGAPTNCKLPEEWQGLTQ
jgi:hypothetical protein